VVPSSKVRAAFGDAHEVCIDVVFWTTVSAMTRESAVVCRVLRELRSNGCSLDEVMDLNRRSAMKGHSAFNDARDCTMKSSRAAGMSDALVE